LVKYKKGDFDAALNDYDQAIKFDPTVPTNYNNRGMAKKKKSDLTGALADFDKAISLNSQSATFHFNRASARDDNGDLDGAIADYDQAVQINPASPKYCYSRGWAKFIKGDLAGAIADYDQAIKLGPENPDAYLNRAYAQYAGGHSSEAEADFHKALGLKDADQDYPRFFICLIKMENPALKSEAVQELADYLPTRPSDAATWPLQVGLFLTGKLAENDFLKAADSSDAKQNADHHCEAYFYVGITHEIAGDKAGARPFFQKSVDTNVIGFSEYQISRTKLQASE
jgi:lipoprotein NlpI